MVVCYSRRRKLVHTSCKFVLTVCFLELSVRAPATVTFLGGLLLVSMTGPHLDQGPSAPITGGNGRVLHDPDDRGGSRDWGLSQRLECGERAAGQIGDPSADQQMQAFALWGEMCGDNASGTGDSNVQLSERQPTLS